MTKTVEVPAAQLAIAGEVLHGPDWRRALARDLGIAERVVRRWGQAAVAGETVLMSRTLLEELAAMLEERAEAFTASASSLRKAATS